MMKIIAGSLFTLTIVLSSSALATGGRVSGFSLGASLSRNMAKVAQPGVDATLSGWANSAEVGFDLSLSDNVGLFFEGGIGQKELRNSVTSSSYLDVTKFDMKSAGGGVFYKSLYLGATYDLIGLDLQTISTQNGSSSTHVDGNGLTYFAGYSIPYKTLLRANIEISSSTFSVPGFSYTDYSAGFKLQLLISGLLEH